MDLHVKQFTVRYQGKDYGSGSVIYDVEQKLAESLIAGSNKTIEALPEREEPMASTTITDADITDGKVDADGDTADGKVGADADDTTTALPSVDPKKTIK